MKRLIAAALLLLSTNLFAAHLDWDAVTTDITGAPDTIASYKVYSRLSGTTNAYVLLGTAITNTFTLPTSSARQEYVVAAVDAAGNVSDLSIPATAKPNAPGNPVVVK